MKYQKFAEIVRENIQNGEYSEFEKLPTEDSLMNMYDVSRYCVRSAINILVQEGEVYPVQGSGMFVRKSKKEGCISLNSTRGITSEFEEDIETKVIKIEIIQADTKLAKRIHCNIGDWLYYIIRVRYLLGEPLAVEYTHYNKEYIPYIDEKIASQSLFAYIKNDLGLSLGFADKVLYCDKLDYVTAEYLELNVGDPAVIVEDDAYLSSGVLFNASRVYYNYKKAKFFGSRLIIR